jgi:ATP-dependent exoDNAse (exonuclease V) beta subunit
VRAFTGGHAESDYAPLTDSSIPRQSVASAVSLDRADAHAGEAARDSARLVGTLVHRLLQQVGFGSEQDDSGLASVMARLLRPDEIEAADAILLNEALLAFKAISRRPDVRELYRTGEAWHEVPFTLLNDGSVVRGTIDCLIRVGGRIVVLEFKTGRTARGHDLQVELYRQAAQALFPGAVVEARVIYVQDTSRNGARPFRSTGA